MLVFDIFRVLQVAIALSGAVVVYYAYRGHNKTGSKSLLLLALGFMFVTIGSVTAGLLFELLNFAFIFVITIESTCELIGFLFIIYSIIGPKI
jgi:hypothetical protein